VARLKELQRVWAILRAMTADVTMPKWPAWLMMAMAAGCAYPAMTTAAPVADRYTARGQEPGWLLTIDGDRIDYQGNYGEKRIVVARPQPRTTFNGHRYETQRLTVDVTHGRCNDAMSGHGFTDQVMVIADGETYRGCGGERRTDWDN
jgi:heat shock protein HslJ